MKKIEKNFGLSAVAITIIICGFQNCGQAKHSVAASSSINSIANDPSPRPPLTSSASPGTTNPQSLDNPGLAIQGSWKGPCAPVSFQNGFSFIQQTYIFSQSNFFLETTAAQTADCGSGPMLTSSTGGAFSLGDADASGLIPIDLKFIQGTTYDVISFVEGKLVFGKRDSIHQAASASSRPVSLDALLIFSK